MKEHNSVDSQRDGNYNVTVEGRNETVFCDMNTQQGNATHSYNFCPLLGFCRTYVFMS